MVERRRATMPPQRRLPPPIGDLLYFLLIGAVVGAVYGHMIAVSEGAPLLGFAGLPRGVLTGVVITGALFLFEQVWARPAMAAARAAVPAASRHKDRRLSPYRSGRSCYRSRAVSRAGRSRGWVANSAPGRAVLLCRGFSHKIHR